MKTRWHSQPALGKFAVGVIWLLSLVAVWVQVASATPIPIDDFAEPSDPYEFYVVDTSSLLVTEQVPGPIGGEREALFQVIGTPTSNSASGIIGYDPDRSLELFGQNTVGTSPTVTTITYNGIGNAGLGGIDLTSGFSNNRFLFEFISAEAQPLPNTNALDLAVIVGSASGTSSADVSLPNSLSPFNIEIFFSQLTPLTGSGATLTNVESIVVKFNSIKQVPNIDFELHAISAVPEPIGFLSMAIGGVMGCCGLKLARRGNRRRR